ncbi:proline dehydrogenase family protein [Planotetraspora sp. A-T 1434]|uniref:proline dehydrogenase family protein n=1 Tax=Planotetraspora sp. A-T 1434 TaxID=2979219 RepID=UPI0021C1105C|nr:proline dehydrogenase family protein [Planotetraspora sp. A-T 1434]MCT9932091.1 proline dehydrogenase family protein [Planotetraspora sp. A-T 1434]
MRAILDAAWRWPARRVAGDVGATVEDACLAVAGLAADGFPVSVGHLGENDEEDFLTLLDALARRGLARGADLTVRPRKLDRESVGRLCEAARDAGATMTLDTEDHTETDATLAVHAALRDEHPTLGVVVQSSLRRAEDDCRSLASARVRLRKGGYDAPPAVAHETAHEADLSYVRCLKILLAGPGHPVIATHDRRLIDVAFALAALNDREPDGFEFQIPYGVRPAERRRLAERGAQVRVYVGVT